MDASLSSLAAPINRFIGKYHPTIFLAFLGLLVAAAIFMLYLVLQPSPDSTIPVTPTISRTFDQGTVKKVQQLRESNEAATALNFPSPRNNPFVE